MSIVCKKSDYHGNSDFQNSQKLDPAKEVQAKIWGSGKNRGISVYQFTT
jgi:hypothetical protein